MLNGLSELCPTSDAIGSKRLTAFLIGLGPGGSKFITVKAEETIRRCGVIVGWGPAISAAGPLVQDKMVFEQQCDNYREMLHSAAEAAVSAKEHLAVLFIDDPLTYSAGIGSYKTLLAGFELAIIPAVGNFQLAAAAARVSLEDSTLIVYAPAVDGSIDKDDLIKKRQHMLKSYHDRYHIIVMSDVEQDLAQTAEFLLDKGLPPKTEIMVGEELGSNDEKITMTDLATVASGCYHWRSMMVIKAFSP